MYIFIYIYVYTYLQILRYIIGLLATGCTHAYSQRTEILFEPLQLTEA